MDKIALAYRRGFIDGLTAFAINKDGKQWVGDPKTELKKAIEQIEEMWNYDPPREEVDE